MQDVVDSTAGLVKGLKIEPTDPVRSLDEAEKWSKLFEDLIVKGAK